MLASACLLGFAMWAPFFVVPPMEHILREELLLTHTQTGLLFTVPLIMMVALSIPGGIVADRIGIRKAAGIGAILIAVGSTLRGTATDFPSLLAFTFIYGAGLGWAFPNLPKLVSLWFPREKVGIATGIYSAGCYVGCSLPVAITQPLIFPITKPSYQVWRNKSLWLIAILYFFTNFLFFNWAGWAPALMMQKGGTTRPSGAYRLTHPLGRYPRCFACAPAFR